MHNAAFHQGLHCLQWHKQSSMKEIRFYVEMITRDPSVYTLDHPKFIASNQKEKAKGGI